jgi:protein gp37
MADIFGKWNDPKQIVDIFEVMATATQHTFILLTKAPENIDSVLYGPPDFYLGGGDFIPNIWIGVSVEKQSIAHRITTLVKSAPYFKKFVSFEPLLEPINCDLKGIEGVIVGAQTNPSVEVTPEMVQPVGEAAFKAGNIPMFCKDSMPKWCCRRELPWKLHTKEMKP